ncbi:MAG: hypothetical protein RQM90_04880 [Methanoculleus sp.]
MHQHRFMRDRQQPFSVQGDTITYPSPALPCPADGVRRHELHLQFDADRYREGRAHGPAGR